MIDNIFNSFMFDIVAGIFSISYNKYNLSESLMISLLEYINNSEVFPEICQLMLSRDFCDTDKRDKGYK